MLQTEDTILAEVEQRLINFANFSKKVADSIAAIASSIIEMQTIGQEIMLLGVISKGVRHQYIHGKKPRIRKKNRARAIKQLRRLYNGYPFRPNTKVLAGRS